MYYFVSDIQNEKMRKRLSEDIKNFRHFFLPLIANKQAKKAYLKEQYHVEFGEPLPPRLKVLANKVHVLVLDKLGLTDLERVSDSNNIQ